MRYYIITVLTSAQIRIPAVNAEMTTIRARGQHPSIDVVMGLPIREFSCTSITPPTVWIEPSRSTR